MIASSITRWRAAPGGRNSMTAASRSRSHRSKSSAISRRSSSTRKDPERAKKTVYGRARNDAQRKGDVIWTPEAHHELVKGEPAELRSRTKITAEQVLAIGLPDLAEQKLGAPGEVEARMAEAEASLPPSMRLDIVTVIDNLLLGPRDRSELQTLAQSSRTCARSACSTTRQAESPAR
jgi:hypothetical protein